MSSLNHTPGPWFVTKSKHGIDGGHFEIAIVAGVREDRSLVIHAADGDDEEEGYGNALLIGAAPDLLGVAREMLPRNLCLTNKNIPDDTIVPLECTMGDLRKVAAAIAKATGQ